MLQTNFDLCVSTLRTVQKRQFCWGCAHLWLQRLGEASNILKLLFDIMPIVYRMCLKMGDSTANGYFDAKKLMVKWICW
jgi:hypothetical protein